VRLEQLTDGRTHSANSGADDHHPQPDSVDFVNKTQSLPPGTSYNLDVTVPDSGFQFARVMLKGPNSAPAMGTWHECAELVVTRDADEAMGHSVRNASPKKVYSVTYSKQNADAYLTHKIFNSGTQNYIGITAAVLTGSVLRLTFRNYFGGSMTLWVEGQALLW
jgi:hypothetical protein